MPILVSHRTHERRKIEEVAQFDPPAKGRTSELTKLPAAGQIQQIGTTERHSGGRLLVEFRSVGGIRE